MNSTYTYTHTHSYTHSYTHTNIMNIEVVVAHYNENLDWTNNLKYKFNIISKSGIPRETPPNKGNEASSYLQYIIERYNTLSDYTIFVHGHRNDWHHKQNIDEKINTLTFDKKYYNINETSVTPLNGFKKEFVVMKELIKPFEKILNTTIDLDNLAYRSSAQFYVSKETIRRHDLSVYVQLYNFLMNHNAPSYWSGRIFEYTFHYIFTGSVTDII